MSLTETITQVQAEQFNVPNDTLIADICEFMNVSEFPGRGSTNKDTAVRLCYFAVRYCEYVIFDRYTRNNAVQVCGMLNRHRSNYFQYKKLLREDAYMIRIVTEFLKKYGYNSQILKP